MVEALVEAVDARLEHQQSRDAIMELCEHLLGARLEPSPVPRETHDALGRAATEGRPELHMAVLASGE